MRVIKWVLISVLHNTQYIQKLISVISEDKN
jgi:hypothetical protein